MCHTRNYVTGIFNTHSCNTRHSLYYTNIMLIQYYMNCVLKRAWQPIPGFLSGASSWTEEPGRLRSIEHVDITTCIEGKLSHCRSNHFLLFIKIKQKDSCKSTKYSIVLRKTMFMIVKNP